ncbi:MAG: 1,2-phenylacetyl-CoA epoxidase subunit B [Bacteroidetes bacterium]|nr:1,2-phenylacetyl-CoA epoxidase subunit B [Bacteroidota bacterium]
MSKSQEWPSWEVFTQNKNGEAHEHAGNVHAPDAEVALMNARDVYGRRQEAVNIWVVPSAAITASTPEDVGSFFDPANDKMYRWPNYFKTPDGIKQI